MNNNFQELFKYGKCEINFSFNINSYSNTAIVVVGCGGTGSRIIPLLTQFIQQHNLQIATNPRNNCYFKHKLDLVLFDNDVV